MPKLTVTQITASNHWRLMRVLVKFGWMPTDKIIGKSKSGKMDKYTTIYEKRSDTKNTNT